MLLDIEAKNLRSVSYECLKFTISSIIYYWLRSWTFIASGSLNVVSGVSLFYFFYYYFNLKFRGSAYETLGVTIILAPAALRGLSRLFGTCVVIVVELGVLLATIIVYVDSKLLLEFGKKLPVFY